MPKEWTWYQDRQRATSRIRETWNNWLFKKDEQHIGAILDVISENRREKLGELHLSGRFDGEILLALKEVHEAFRP